MSTKSTLVYGKTFRLYEEVFERTPHVWLELEDCEFEATPRGVRVGIPLPVWEVLRQHTPARCDLAPLTDRQLLSEAEDRVEAARTEYRAALARERATRQAGKLRGSRKTMIRFFHRLARLPRAQHLESVLASLREDRSQQRRLLRAISRLAAPTSARPPAAARHFRPELPPLPS